MSQPAGIKGPPTRLAKQRELVFVLHAAPSLHGHLFLAHEAEDLAAFLQVAMLPNMTRTLGTRARTSGSGSRRASGYADRRIGTKRISTR